MTALIEPIPRIEPVRFGWAGCTSAGDVARSDEHFLVGDLERGFEVACTSHHQLWRQVKPELVLKRPLAMVMDGVGGQPHADEASGITLLSVAQKLIGLTAPVRAGAAVSAVSDGLQAASATLHEQSATRVPAASATCALVNWPTLSLVHVGHSRAYLVRHGRMARMTTDHTMSEEIRHAGFEPRKSLERVLLRAVGAPDSTPDRSELELMRGDTVLLASAGLGEVLDDDELARLVASRPLCTAVEHCETLRKAVAERAPERNVTVVVLTVR